MTHTSKTPAAGPPCSRCGGNGELPRFRHVEGGVCFRCRGKKIDPGPQCRRGRRALPKLLSDDARKLLANVVEWGTAEGDEGVKELLKAGLVGTVTTETKGGRKGRAYFATERVRTSYNKAVKAGLTEITR